MKMLFWGLLATTLVGCSASVSTESGSPEPDLSTVGVAPGSNPSLSAEQQVAAFQSLQHATSVHFPSDMKREPIVAVSDIRSLAAKLSIKPLNQQPRGESRCCLTFKLATGRETRVHVWPKCWGFTGGPRREYHDDLWHHLGLDEQEK